MNTHFSIILVHGAWQSSRCWKAVAQDLSAAGVSVLTPDLPGHGSRLLPGNKVTFKDYTDSIIELIEQQSVPVTLVGHSMAGLIISQVAELIPQRIKKLVYVAAYIPQDGDSLFSMAEAGSSRGLSPYIQLNRSRDEIELYPAAEAMSVLYSMGNELERRDALSDYQAQPMQPFSANVALGKNFENTQKMAILCRYDRAVNYTDQLRMSKQVENSVTLEADHSPFYSAAQALSEVLDYKM